MGGGAIRRGTGRGIRRLRLFAVTALSVGLVAGCGAADTGRGPGASGEVATPRSAPPTPEPTPELSPSGAAARDCEGQDGDPADAPTWLLRLVTPGPQYSVADDGTVVEVAKTDIFASVQDYRTWTISDDAVEVVLTALRDRAGDVPDVPLAEGTFVDVLDPCSPHVGGGWGLQAASVLAAITDPGERVTEPVLWRPDDLWLIVHPTDGLGTPNGSSEPFRPWPLPGTIADHVVGHDVYRLDGADPVPVRWVCLRGEQVTPLWELQQPGTRNTWIRLEDAEGRWEVTIRPAWPGYRLSDDPCGEVT